MKTLRRIAFVAAAFALSATIAYPLVASSRVHAAELLPSRFEKVDALELENATLKLSQLEQQAQPLAAKRAEILARYKIDPAQLGKTVGYDLQTGEIKRAAVMAAPAAPKK